MVGQGGRYRFREEKTGRDQESRAAISGRKIPLFIMEAVCEARQWQEKVAGQPLPG